MSARAELPEVWVGDVVRARELCAGGELVIGRVRGGSPHYRTLTIGGARVVCAWEGVTVLAHVRHVSCRRALRDGVTRAADGPIGALKLGAAS